MLAAAATSAGIGELLDAILSVEEVDLLPHPTVYQLALDRLGAAAPGRLPVLERLGRERRRGLRPACTGGSTAWACRRSACLAWPSTSFPLDLSGLPAPLGLVKLAGGPTTQRG